MDVKRIIEKHIDDEVVVGINTLPILIHIY